jgi:hypothetical protein
MKPLDTKARKEKLKQQAMEGAQAMADYEAQIKAMLQKTERLRAARLARDAAVLAEVPVKKKGKAIRRPPPVP